MSNQFKGLFIKNIQLIGRQKGSLICQIITPMFCLIFIMIIKILVESQIKKSGYGLKVQMPMLFNIPIYSKFRYAHEALKITSCEEWYLYSFDEEANTTFAKNFFGFNNGEFASDSEGILKRQKNIIQTKCENIAKMSPYFIETKNNTINDDLYIRIESLNDYDINKLENDTVLSVIPDGAITVHEINQEKFSYTIQVNDMRIPQYHRNNGITKLSYYNKNTDSYSNVLNVLNGQLWASDLFNKAYFKNFFDDVFIMSGVQLMPLNENDNQDNIQRIINVAGVTIYPVAISLLMPLFMYTIVLEKESKLIEIMKINGMKMKNYWFSNFTFNFILYAATILVFNLFGVGLSLSMFTQTSPMLLFIIYLGWGLCQIGMAFFFQAFLSNAKTATIIGYIISLWTVITGTSLNLTLFQFPKPMPTWLLFYPSFNISRIFYFLTTSCGYNTCMSSFNHESFTTEFKTCLIVLYISAFLYIILGIYLYEVLPQQFGIRKHPLFFLKNLWKKHKRIRSKSADLITHETIPIESADDEVVEEQRKVENITKEDKKKYPLIVDNLTKVYVDIGGKKGRIKRALNGVNLVLNKNEIFGLLGPNGAGKTTFFSLLTGIYEPTEGNAWVGGHSIKEKIVKVQELIGYCPQFDLLWEDLSVEEHLYFYSRLKNVGSDVSKQNVENILRDIKLENFRGFLVKELSGGMKRRLSLGISLVGNPSIVFLDEPTTGLDPENKRQIWEILSNCKTNKCMILTTHLMEEAEVLSDRIGIIVNGSLKCLGTQYKLKKNYGKGFKLVINLVSSSVSYNSIGKNKNLSEEEFLEERSQNIINFIKKFFPNSNLHENYKNTLIFEIPNEEFDAEIIFYEMDKRKDDLQINNWAISQVTLEDIFIRLTENDI